MDTPKRITSSLGLLLLTALSLGAGDPEATPSPLEQLEAARAANVGNVVVVDFWASWCGPCQQSFPWMDAMLTQHGENGLVFLTVNVDRDRKAADRFLKQAKSELPVIYDPEGSIPAKFEVEAMPSSYVYGRDGRLRFHHQGFTAKQAADLETELGKLLAEEAVPHDAASH